MAICAAHAVRPSSARPTATGSDRDFLVSSLVSSDVEAIDRSLRGCRETRLVRISRIIRQSWQAALTGSMPAAFHQACSSLARWTAC